MKVVKYLTYIVVLVVVLTIVYMFSPPIAGITAFIPITDQTMAQRIPIITFADNQINSETVVDSSQSNETSCSKKHTNFVFVKTHKTGTSTTVNILYHFGIINGLNYAIYPYSHQLHLVRPERLV